MITSFYMPTRIVSGWGALAGIGRLARELGMSRVLVVSDPVISRQGFHADALARLAEEGMGFVQVMQGFDYSRALIGLQCCACAQASLDESWAYIGQREAFGVPIAQYQGVSFPLAEGEGLVERLAAALGRAHDDRGAVLARARRARSLARPDATARIAELCMECAA